MDERWRKSERKDSRLELWLSDDERDDEDLGNTSPATPEQEAAEGVEPGPSGVPPGQSPAGNPPGSTPA